MLRVTARSVLTGLSGTQAEGAQIRVLNDVPDVKVFPNLTMIEVISAGRSRFPLGGPYTVEYLKRVTDRENVRGTTIFRIAIWELDVPETDAERNRYAFVLDVRENKLDCARVLENYLLALDYEPLNVTHHDAPYLGVRVDGTVLQLRTEYGLLAIVPDSTNIMMDTLNIHMNLDESLRLFAAIILHRPRRVFFDGSYGDSMKFLQWLWRGIRSIRVDAAYVHVAVVCLTNSYPDAETCVTLLRMLNTGLLKQTDAPNTHVETQLVMNVIRASFESEFTYIDDVDEAESQERSGAFLMMALRAAISQLRTRIYDDLKFAGRPKLRVRKPRPLDTLFAYEFLSCPIVRQHATELFDDAHESISQIVFMDVHLTAGMRDVEHANAFTARDNLIMTLGPINWARKISESTWTVGGIIARQIDDDLVVDVIGSTDELAEESAGTVDTCMTRVVRGPIDEITPLLWTVGAMKTQTFGYHESTASAVRHLVDLYDESVHLSELIFSSATIDANDVSTSAFSVLLFVAYLAQDILIYLGAGQFKIVDARGLRWIFSFMAGGHGQIDHGRSGMRADRGRGLAGPLTEVMWYPSPRAIDVAIQWASENDAHVLCPAEAYEAFVTRAENLDQSMILRHEAIEGNIDSIREYVLYEPSRLGPAGRKLLLGNRFQRSFVIGEFVSSLETWKPWLDRTYYPIHNHEMLMSRIIGAIRGTRISYRVSSLPRHPRFDQLETIAAFVHNCRDPVVIVLKHRSDFHRIELLLPNVDLTPWNPVLSGVTCNAVLVRASLYSAYRIEGIVHVLAMDTASGYRIVHRSQRADGKYPILWIR